MKALASLFILLFSVRAGSLRPQGSAADYLAANTVLIVRHAEKPASGQGLTVHGENRAKSYATYFEPFHEQGWHVDVNALFAGADSASSVRPRLTLEPLSRATGLPIDSSVSTKEPQKLVTLLRTQQHGSHPLIAWRHGQIPSLLQALGATPDLIAGGRWPDEVYDWVVVLQFAQNGTLRKQQLIHETLVVP